MELICNYDSCMIDQDLNINALGIKICIEMSDVELNKENFYKIIIYLKMAIKQYREDSNNGINM